MRQGARSGQLVVCLPRRRLARTYDAGDLTMTLDQITDKCIVWRLYHLHYQIQLNIFFFTNLIRHQYQVDYVMNSYTQSQSEDTSKIKHHNSYYYAQRICHDPNFGW